MGFQYAISKEYLTMHIITYKLSNKSVNTDIKAIFDLKKKRMSPSFPRIVNLQD